MSQLQEQKLVVAVEAVMTDIIDKYERRIYCIPNDPKGTRRLLSLVTAEGCLQAFAHFLKEALLLSEEEVNEIGSHLLSKLNPLIDERGPVLETRGFNPERN